MKEFHISRLCRERYNFDQSLFSLDGNVLFANFHAARMFAQKMNQKRDLVTYPEQSVKAGTINGMGLIDEILHLVIGFYQRQKNPLVMQQAADWVADHVSLRSLDQALAMFTTQFPPVAVYQNKISVEDYLAGKDNGVPNRVIALEEMLMLWIANKNDAFFQNSELFDDQSMAQESSYIKIISELHAFFETQPKFGPDQQNLMDMLRSPAVHVPYSIFGQLDYIRNRWGDLLGNFLYRLLNSLDLLKEEEKLSFSGPGPVAIPTYPFHDDEMERFSFDREWMPRLVLIAKNSHVWLDQLSKKYERQILRLDQIPDEELQILADWGFSGLWLIGLWERSKASAQIKQMCGNPEADASAYSLATYQIAADLGGEGSFQNLRDRAWQMGIRLASDMVPNHMGIDSSWVVEKPEWFISLDQSPFPSYTFNSPDLSPDSGTEIFIEDHYFNRTDAAVVFKRIDHNSGQARYIYHGNDGTSMPWNDTAQLNYLNPEVREAVIQTIIDVARRFPIIRFDAAMTLTKRHYQRLWYPQPGEGGDIPSRAGLGLSREQFNDAMPEEFWREVVDRIGREAPDTLLLAEAFWLMEGFFVRTLGMHRVYNSAFMNLLRNEENAKYRTVMKNTLEYDPQILKRFVNFMNNPDERTAIDQFGNGDKYFGICTMMATMPGLPMFGHGQIEGYSEKYGMEYRRSYWDEKPDEYLIERHRREIFPLLHNRPLFADVDNFLLYDFFSPEGSVNENVFAYSNAENNKRALVIYHNRFADTKGWVHRSAAFSVKKTDGEKISIQRSLGEGLGLSGGESTYLIFRDQVSGFEYIRRSNEVIEKGLFVELGAYKAHVFLDFQEIQDDKYNSHRHLCEYLNGGGVPNIQDSLKELMLQPIHDPFNEIANPGYFNFLLGSRLTNKNVLIPEFLLCEAVQKMTLFLQGVEKMYGYAQNTNEVLTGLRTELETLLTLLSNNNLMNKKNEGQFSGALKYLREGAKKYSHQSWSLWFGWLFTHSMGKLFQSQDFETVSESWFEEWQLGKLLCGTYRVMGNDDAAAQKMLVILHLLINQEMWFEKLKTGSLLQTMEEWLSNHNTYLLLGINRYQEVLWFKQESFQEFVWYMTFLAIIRSDGKTQLSTTDFVERAIGVFNETQKLLSAMEKSGFQVGRLLEAVKQYSSEE